MLAAGSRLGPYEILSSLGAGGMGEVYQARDTRLGRTVAIKVLASHLAESPERRQRFEREARAVSSLNHPHIAALYDIGSEDGVDFLVMECVEGQTLAERLKKGALPINETLRYGAQMADALDKAHRQGIVHRDLKPSNLMLTKSGVKVLDFGLAKLEEREPDVVVDSSASTEAKTLTEEGTILGTLQYMAPEQLEGKSVDARADLFALGGILYEMVTGRPAFEGKSQASLIAAILEHDPAPVSSVEPTASSALDHAIGRCLKKDPEERWQTALDLENELEWIATSAPVPSAPFVSRRRAWLVPMMLAAVTLAMGLVGGAYLTSDAPRAESVLRAAIPLAPNRLARPETLPPALAPMVSISANGEHIAYVGERDAATGIYLQATNESRARWMSGSEGGTGPFFSPNGSWLGFISRNSLWKIPVGGGAPVPVIKEVVRIRGADWGDDGYIYFTPSLSAGVWRVRESGGEAERVTALDYEKREKTHRFPHVLPDEKGVLFTMGSADIDSFDEAQIEVFSLETGERRTLIEGGTNARYLPTGHIAYVREDSIFAVPFDLQTLEVTGPAVRVLEGVTTSPVYGPAHFAVSDEGLLVYLPGGPRTGKTRIVSVDRNGTSSPILDLERTAASLRSLDARRIAVNIWGACDSVWIYDLFRGTLTRAAFGWDNTNPTSAPNGKYVTFGSNRAGPFNIFRKAIDGSGPAERLTHSEHRQSPGSWSPDGSLLTFEQQGDIWVLPVGNGAEPYPLLDSIAWEREPDVSPDGRWLAYVSDESGRDEVYVQSFPESGPRLQVSTNGGFGPAWAPSGEELFYRSGDSMMVVEIVTNPELEMSAPRAIFDASPYLGGSGRRTYDIAPDGKRFLMIEELEPEPLPDHLSLIVNWFDELESHFTDD